MVAIPVPRPSLPDWGPKLTEWGGHFVAHVISPRYFLGRIAWLVVLGTIAVEGLLAVRAWAQLTNQATDEGMLVRVFGITDFLISPFQQLETTPPLRPTGVLEFATLVAMEVYLAAAICSLVLIFILPRLVRLAIFLVRLSVKLSRQVTGRGATTEAYGLESR